MKDDEKRQIELLNDRLKQPLRLKLVKTRHDASRHLEDFCVQMQDAAPKIQIGFEKEDGKVPPGLQIHPRIRYQSVPVGRELAPFLRALRWIAEGRTALPIPDVLDDLSLPADLKLYISEHCPFCPGVVESLLPLALASPWVRLTVIDAGLLMEEAGIDHVQSVPTLILDSQFRWTGTVQIPEVIDAMIHRDPSRLTADALMNMIADGNAGLLSTMMLEMDLLFPAFLELLVHPKWPVRLGAMVALETIAAEKPLLARQTIPPLWERFDGADDKVKGDILYIMGEVDSGGSVPRIQDILNRKNDFDAEILEAAEEALEKLKNRV